jgi:hypothetical protein
MVIEGGSEGNKTPRWLARLLATAAGEYIIEGPSKKFLFA